MPNRILWEKACRSTTLAELSAEEERLFWRLLTQADDFGRFDARVPVVRAGCFPLRLNKVSERHVLSWLNALGDAQAVQFYGPAFGFFTGWERHQRRRAAKSKFPDPKDFGDVRGHLTSVDSNGQPMSPYSYSYSNSKFVFVKPAADDSEEASGRVPDPMFEVLVEACEYDLANLTATQRGRVNKAAKELRDLGVDPALVRGFADLWPDHYPNATLTPQAITGNWADYMAGKLWTKARTR